MKNKEICTHCGAEIETTEHHTTMRGKPVTYKSSNHKCPALAPAKEFMDKLNGKK
jgi:hypothetical protein